MEMKNYLYLEGFGGIWMCDSDFAQVALMIIMRDTELGTNRSIFSHHSILSFLYWEKHCVLFRRQLLLLWCVQLNSLNLLMNLRAERIGSSCSDALFDHQLPEFHQSSQIDYEPVILIKLIQPKFKYTDKQIFL